MNPTAKIMVSVTAGILTGAVLGILLSERNEPKNIKTLSKKIAGDIPDTRDKNKTLEKEMEEAVKEAFAENPEEYA